MDADRFVSKDFGSVIRTPGPHGYYTFIPARMPRSLDLDAKTVAALSTADRALGRLRGLHVLDVLGLRRGRLGNVRSMRN